MDNGDGNCSSGRRSTAGGDGNVRFRRQDDDNNISMGGSNAEIFIS
jgi:hypothetical protein